MAPRGIIFAAFLTGFQVITAQNQKADGYMGLWSRSGQPSEYGYKFSGGTGTYSPQHVPLAIYSPESAKTFFVYNGTSRPDVSHLQIMISYFDHRTHRVPKPVIVYDKMGVNDPQDNASLSIDSKGYLYVFVSGRGRTRPGLIFKSRNPYSIDSFDTIMEGEIVFPQPWWVNDSCFVLMHIKVRNGRELYWTTSRDGATWSEAKKLAGMGGHFQITGVTGNRIVSVFNYFPGGNSDRRTNLYLLQTNDFGKTWRTIDGKIVETPVTDIHSEALIKDFESEGKLVYIKDLNFDKEGNPVILVLISRDYRPGPSGDPRELIVIHRSEGRWRFDKVCESHHNYDMGSLYITPGEWRILSPTEPGSRKYETGGEIVEWKSTDSGITWTRGANLTAGSNRNDSFVRRPFNASKDFYAIWTDGDPDKLSPSGLFFTNEACERVWMLPNAMKKDFEKPVRVK